MTAQTQPTLRVVLGLEGDDDETGRSLFGESGAALRELRSHLDEGLPPGVLTAVRDQLGEAVAAACDVPLTTIFAEAWKKYEPLREYCDSERHPAGETATVELATHTVRSVQHPTVEFLVGEKSVLTLKLDAEIEIKLESAVLTMGDGMFQDLATGRSEATAALSYKGAVLAERKLGEYKLPGKISFGEGIPICPDTSRSASSRVQMSTSVPIFDPSADRPAR